MNRNHRIKKKVMSAAACGLAAAIGTMQICTLPVFAQETDSAEIYKEETVYVNADASGRQTNVTVSDWLKNAGASESVRDESILENIQNIKGDETFTSDGNSVIWNTQGKDIYYQGTTDKELPVSVSLTWYLDGEEISPDELNGKSGHLQIRIDYRNDSLKTVTIDGKEEEVYSPFVMMTGIILPEENCSDVMIDNGRVISDGNRNIVVGFAMPGMKESLGITEEDSAVSDVLLPESLTVSAEVKDFTVPSTYTVALSDLLSETDLDQITGISEIQNALDDLEDAAVKLVSGSSELSDGASELSRGVDSYTEGMDKIRRAVSTYLGEDGELSGKVTEYADGVDTVTLGIQSYIAGTEDLADGVTAYVNGENQLAEGAEQLTELSRGLVHVQSALAELETLTDGKTDNDGGKDLAAAAQKLADGMETLEKVCGSDAVKELADQLESMSQTGQELLTQTKELDEAASQNLIQPVQNIADQLNTLSGELEKMSECKANLESACSQVNEMISSDNAIIAEAKEKGADVSTSVSASIAALETQKEELESTSPEAAEELDKAIGALKTAGESAEALQTLTDLEPIQNENLWTDQVDAEAVRQAAQKISDNMASFSSAAETLNEQLPELQKKLEDLEQQADSLPDGSAEEFMQQIKLLSTGMQQLNDAIGGKNGLSENITILSQSATASFPEAVEGLDALSTGFESLSMYNSSLLDGAADLKEAGKLLSDGTETLKAGTGTLVSGFGTLGSQLDRGTALLSENSGQLRDGAASLKDGAAALSDSMNLFERDGTATLKRTAEEQLGEVIDRLKALDSDEAAYDTYSGKEESMEGTVKFVIETEAY